MCSPVGSWSPTVCVRPSGPAQPLARAQLLPRPPFGQCCGTVHAPFGRVASEQRPPPDKPHPRGHHRVAQPVRAPLTVPAHAIGACRSARPHARASASPDRPFCSAEFVCLLKECLDCLSEPPPPLLSHGKCCRRSSVFSRRRSLTPTLITFVLQGSSSNRHCQPSHVGAPSRHCRAAVGALAR
jgi:hypothetical protein